MNIYATQSTMKRFLSVALSLGKPARFCHQTLTFKQEKRSIHEVKKPLNTLLDTLHKRHSMVSLYAVEWSQKHRLHIHVLFLFYESPPYNGKHWLNRFGREVFKAWNRLNQGELVRQANLTTLPEILDPTYLCKSVRVLKVGETKSRDPANWWGLRNKEMLHRHAVPADKEQIKNIVLTRKKHKSPITEADNWADSFDWRPDPLIEDEQSNHSDSLDRYTTGRHDTAVDEEILLMLLA
jgi:hypothetical protein